MSSGSSSQKPPDPRSSARSTDVVEVDFRKDPHPRWAWAYVRRTSSAFRRISSIHWGSFFFAEMSRTTFSSRPRFATWPASSEICPTVLVVANALEFGVHLRISEMTVSLAFCPTSQSLRPFFDGYYISRRHLPVAGAVVLGGCCRARPRRLTQRGVCGFQRAGRIPKGFIGVRRGYCGKRYAEGFSTDFSAFFSPSAVTRFRGTCVVHVSTRSHG